VSISKGNNKQSVTDCFIYMYKLATLKVVTSSHLIFNANETSLIEHPSQFSSTQEETVRDSNPSLHEVILSSETARELITRKTKINLPLIVTS